MNGAVKVRDAKPGECITADRITFAGMPCEKTMLSAEEVARATEHLSDGVGSVVLSIEFGGASVLFIVQSIDLDFA